MFAKSKVSGVSPNSIIWLENEGHFFLFFPFSIICYHLTNIRSDEKNLCAHLSGEMLTVSQGHSGHRCSLVSPWGQTTGELYNMYGKMEVKDSFIFHAMDLETQA